MMTLQQLKLQLLKHKDMANKDEKKAIIAKEVGTKSETIKKAPVKKKAKVSKDGTVEVTVKAIKFGTYKKGDVIVMNESTAKACVAHKIVAYK